MPFLDSYITVLFYTSLILCLLKGFSEIHRTVCNVWGKGLDEGVVGGERGSHFPTMLLLAGFPQERATESLHLVADGVPSTESIRAEGSPAPSHGQCPPVLRSCDGGGVR